jgi:hypothetical protein
LGRPVKEISKPFFHWDYANVVIGICVGGLLTMLMPNSVCTWTYICEVITIIWTFCCLFHGEYYKNNSAFIKIVKIISLSTIFALLMFFTVQKQKQDREEGTAKEQSEVEENLIVTMEIPYGKDVFESYVNITNTSKIKLFGVKPVLVLNSIQYGDWKLPCKSLTLDYSKMVNLDPGESTQCFSMKNGFSKLIFSRPLPFPKGQCVDLDVIVPYMLITQPKIKKEKRVRFVTLPFGDGKTWVSTDDPRVRCY